MDTVLAFDMGATKTIAAMLGYDCKPLAGPIVWATPHNPQEGLERFRAALNDFFRRGYSIGFIVGGAPAIAEDGCFLENPSNLPEWSRLHLKRKLESIVGETARRVAGSRYPYNITVRSDAELGIVGASLAKAATAEDADKWFPLSYDAEGSGFGVGLSVRKGNEFEVYRNANGKGLEAGHNISFFGRAPNQSGINCGHCSINNCYETWLGGKFMESRYGLRPEEATEEIQDMVAYNFSKILAALELPYRPVAHILNGGVARNWGERFLGNIRKYSITHFGEQGRELPNLELSLLGIYTELVGAWGIAMRHYQGAWPRLDSERTRQLIRTPCIRTD